MTPDPSPDRRAAANRLNAARSTGPRTPEGKARVAQNGIVHGIHTLSPVIEGMESPQQWTDFWAALLRSMLPARSRM